MPYSTNSINNRSYLINQPQNPQPKAVIFLHGLGGNANSVKSQLGDPDPDNYYIVFPNGTPIAADPLKLRWYASGGLFSLIDSGYIGNIIAHLKGLGVTEITIAGHSMGAKMSGYLLANYSENFKAGLLISAFLDNNVDVLSKSENPNIPIRLFHGLKDDVVLPVENAEDLVTSLIKFIDGGFSDTKAELINKTHSLDLINENNFVINQIESLMGV